MGDPGGNVSYIPAVHPAKDQEGSVLTRLLITGIIMALFAFAIFAGQELPQLKRYKK